MFNISSTDDIKEKSINITYYITVNDLSTEMRNKVLEFEIKRKDLIKSIFFNNIEKNIKFNIKKEKK